MKSIVEFLSVLFFFLIGFFGMILISGTGQVLIGATWMFFMGAVSFYVHSVFGGKSDVK